MKKEKKRGTSGDESENCDEVRQDVGDVPAQPIHPILTKEVKIETTDRMKLKYKNGERGGGAERQGEEGRIGTETPTTRMDSRSFNSFSATMFWT